MAETAWWEKRWFLALIVLASTIPLLLPETPPLVDMPGHLGRFRVQLDLANSPELQRYFEFHWALIGNLGVDLLVMLLAPLTGLEPAVKLIVMTIPPITAAGIFWVSKEVHGRIPPTALFAIPFVYSFPFNFGFINFSLAVGLALLAFGYWLRLTRQSRFKLRFWIFIPIGCALWVVHAFGWGILGLLAFSTEAVRRHDLTKSWQKTLLGTSLQMTPLALPIVVMATVNNGMISGSTTQFFDTIAKLYSVSAVLQDRWLIWDCVGVSVAFVLMVAALVEPAFCLSRKMAFSSGVLLIVFVIMPSHIFGLQYGDARLLPILIMTFISSIQISDEHSEAARRIAILGLSFFVLRIVGTTASFAIADNEARTWLSALDHVPEGAPVLSLVGVCNDQWNLPRHSHLGGFVIARRNGFSNDQWQAAGAQLMRIRYPIAGEFQDERSSVVYSNRCKLQFERLTGKQLYRNHTPEPALRRFPRAAFDYVWMIEPGDFDMRAMPGLTPIWRRKGAVLYRVERARATEAPPLRASMHR